MESQAENEMAEHMLFCRELKIVAIFTFLLVLISNGFLQLRFLVQQNTALFSTFRPSSVLLRHRRDISTFLDILTVYTMETIYFLNAYYLGW